MPSGWTAIWLATIMPGAAALASSRLGFFFFRLDLAVERDHALVAVFIDLHVLEAIAVQG